jgi:putative endonuclease
MRQERHYSVYILASFTGTLYIGVTSNLPRRVWQQKQHAIEGFTAERDVTRLLCFEVYNEVLKAIAREKQLKGWVRRKKIALIEKDNPRWEDLSREWYKPDTQTLAVKIAHPEERGG